MSINKFEDISGLILHINGADSEITKTGNFVDTIKSTVPLSGSVSETVYSGANPGDYVSHDPDNIKIGQLPSFHIQENVPAAFIDNDSYDFAGHNGPMTVLAVYQYDDVSSSPGSIYDSRNTNNQAHHIGQKLSNNGEDVAAWIQNGTYQSSIPITNNVTISVLRYDRHVTSTVVFDVDGINENVGTKSNEATHGLRRFTLFCGHDIASNTESTGGKVGIIVAYQKRLTDSEVADAVELAQYYIDNGRGPVVIEHPTSGIFDADTNDPNATITWTAKRFIDTDFEDVETRLSDARVIDNPVNGLTDGRLNIVSAKTSDSGIVRCTCTTSYQTVIRDVDLVVEAI